MRIRAKFISGYLVIALVTTCVAVLSFFATRTLENAFRAVSEETIPLITTMDELRYSASRVVASATEVALAIAMGGGQAAGSVAAEEKQELDMGYEAFQQARKKYIDVTQTRTITPDEAPVFELIRSTSGVLRNLLEELIVLQRGDAPGSQVLTKMERVEAYEMTLLFAIDAALAEENTRSDERETAVLRAIDHTRRTAVMIGPGAVMLAIMAALYLMRRILHALAALKNVSLAWSAGHLDVRMPQLSRDELGDVARSFNDMAAALKRQDLELRATKSYLDEIIDSMADALVVSGKDGTVRTVNPALRQLLGYRPDQLLRRPVEDLFPEGVAERQWMQRVKAREDVRNIDTVCLAGNGTMVPVRLSATVLCSPGGEIHGTVYVLQRRTGEGA
ncbi:MAG: PAS domain-containing protein [Gammaproteobacteria bacterium]|jgi:PAS domain S-box-containing protein